MKYMTLSLFSKFSFVLLLALSFLIILVLCNAYLTHSFTMGAFYNSDALYVPEISSDLLNNPFSIVDWNLSRAPSFFDILLFYLVNTIFSSYLSIMVFFILQVLVTIVLIKKIFFLFFSDDYLANILTSVSLLFLTIVLLTQIHPYFLAIKSAHHYSTFIMWLFSSYFFFKNVYKSSSNNYYLFLFFIFLFSISDQLYIVHFVFPLALFLMLDAFFNSRTKVVSNIKLTFNIFLVTILAIIISKYMFSISLNNSLSFSISKSINDISVFWVYFIKLLSSSFILITTNIIFYISCLYTFKCKECKVKPFTVFYFISLFVSMLILALSPTSRLLGRYMLPFLFVPVLFTFVLLSKSLLQRFKFYILTIIIFMLIYIFSMVKFCKWESTYYPNHIACVDNVIKEYKISSFAGDYWVSRHYNFLSRNGLSVTPFDASFTVVDIVSNSQRIKNSFSGFLVNSIDGRGFKSEEIIYKFGNPSKNIHCDKVDLLIYNKNHFKLNSQNNIVKNE